MLFIVIAWPKLNPHLIMIKDKVSLCWFPLLQFCCIQSSEVTWLAVWSIEVLWLELFLVLAYTMHCHWLKTAQKFCLYQMVTTMFPPLKITMATAVLLCMVAISGISFHWTLAWLGPVHHCRVQDTTQNCSFLTSLWAGSSHLSAAPFTPTESSSD